jgi:hypothetical protein
MSNLEYPKIPGPFKRFVEGPRKNKLDLTQWTSPELELLKDVEWIWTEKVDGTNIRIMWNGHKVTYGGRTDNAQIPAKLIAVLDNLFTEEIFEQVFAETPVILYGEGYGAGIQSGGVYRPDMSFVLFDVRVGNLWLTRVNVEDVAVKLGIDVVPVYTRGSVMTAIDIVTHGVPSSWHPTATAEGLVGVTSAGLLNRAGERIIVKIKTRDFLK